ncbi:MAG: CBS domain-containing protein [Candidatus Korobacteraceae bacterium]
MKSWSISIGRLFGSELRIHVSFLFLLAFVWMSESSQLGTRVVERSLAFTAIVFGSVLLHHLGHLLFAASRDRASSQARGRWLSRVVVLMPIGDVALTGAAARSKPDADQELKRAILAPALNLAAALIVGSIVLTAMPETDLREPPLVTAANLPRSAVWINIMLAVLNFLPAYPMDAGRVLRALLVRKMELLPATRKAVGIGQGFALLFMIAGIWNTWWMLIGFFLFLAAQLEERSVLFHAVLDQVKLEEVMLTDFTTLSPADTLEFALEKAVHTLQDDFPVVRGGDMVGVISRRHIVDALREEGNGYVQGAMMRGFGVANRTDTLGAVFSKLTAPGNSMLPVVHENRLVGIVTLQNLMHSMSLLAEKRRAGFGQQA